MESKNLLLLSRDDLETTVKTFVSEALDDRRPDLIRIDEASEYLQISKPALYTLVHRDQIPFHKVAKYLFFSRKELENWIRSGGKETIQLKR